MTEYNMVKSLLVADMIRLGKNVRAYVKLNDEQVLALDEKCPDYITNTEDTMRESINVFEIGEDIYIGVDMINKVDGKLIQFPNWSTDSLAHETVLSYIDNMINKDGETINEEDLFDRFLLQDEFKAIQLENQPEEL